MTIARLIAVVLFAFGGSVFFISLWAVHPGLVIAIIGGFIAAVGIAAIKEEFSE